MANNQFVNFSQIPNHFIDQIPELNLTSNQLKLCLKLFKLSFGKKIFYLNDSIRNSLMKYLNVKRWDRVKRVLNILQEKSLIFCKEIKCQIEITFSKILQNKTSNPADALEKQAIKSNDIEVPNTLNNNILPFEKKEEYKSSIPSYIPEPKQERKNPDLNISPIREVNNTKGINNHSKEQPITREQTNDIKIDNQYLKALKAQMLKYNYTNQQIELTEKLIFKAKNKNIKPDRIDDLAKSLIYNKIDRSTKRKPINDIKAFIISSLFSKEERFIFHKLEHIKDFPYSEIKTESDIRIEADRKRAAELLQVQQEEQKRRSREQKRFENMENALKDKLKDKFETEFLKTKQSIIKKTNNQFIPWPEVITSLYKTIFNADMTICSGNPEQSSC